MAFNISTQESQYIPKWNNNDKVTDPITLNLKVLNSKDYWQLMAICKKLDSGNDVQTYLESLRSIFQKYITSIQNLTVDNKVLSPSNLVDYPVLFSLLTELMLELVNQSSITENDKKKLTT